MKTLQELLNEAKTSRSSESLKKEAAADNTAASGIDEVVNYLISGGEAEMTKKASETLESSTISSKQELIEKIAESFMTLETCLEFSLANLRDGMIKEASDNGGKSEKEINELIVKLANKHKQGLSAMAKFLLGIGATGAGLGAIAGGAAVGHKMGYKKGQTDEFANIASALSTPYGGEGGGYYGTY